MPAKRAFVIGANRGIGLKFVEEFVQEGWEVCGSIRPRSREDISVHDLRRTGVRIFEIDYLEDVTIANAAEQFGPGPLDCLVNCAGISHGPVMWQEYNNDILTEHFQIMVVGPLLATKHFLPNLEQSVSGGKVVNLSSRLASVGLNDNGRKIGCKIAKAALNAETKTIAMDLKKKGSRVAMMAISPGWVKTKLSGWQGETEIVESVDGMFAVIQNLTMEDTGRFWNWTGDIIPY